MVLSAGGYCNPLIGTTTFVYMVQGHNAIKLTLTATTMNLPTIADLRTNRAFSVTQRASLRALLAQREEAHEELEEEYDDAEAAFLAATEARDDSLRDIELLAAALSPTRAVPDDILLEIFRHTTRFDCGDEQEDYETTDPKAGLVLVSHVCSRWRRVALGTPSHWNHIVFATRRGSQVALPVLLRRSEGPLHITVNAASCRTTSMEDVLGRLIADNEAGFVDRISTLSIQCHPDELYGFVLTWNHKLVQGPTFPRLRALNVGLNLGLESHKHTLVQVSHVLRYFQNSPALETLSFLSEYDDEGERSALQPLILDRTPLAPRLPWAQLRSLTFFTNVTFDALAHISQRCVNIEELSFRCSIVVADDGEGTPLTMETMPKFTLPRLHTMQHHDWGSIPALTFLTTPALKHLHLHIPASLDPEDMVSNKELGRFQDRSGFSLETLSVWCLNGEHEMFIQFLARNPMLRKFSIESTVGGAGSERAVVAALVASADRDVLVPQLRELALEVSEMCGDAVYDLIRSRTRTAAGASLTAPLEYVAIALPGRRSWHVRAASIVQRVDEVRVENIVRAYEMYKLAKRQELLDWQQEARTHRIR
ncbi:hypothetical protein MKEN_01475200 [Mycena kentingensis (nom. inval.)]|nr:hypothetical protein MKEN_01475200 [Mycena kentingensis (nom. inval.)]